MTATSFSPEVLRFHCPRCGAELTVPATLAGIDGPCPSCCQIIQAPLLEALYEMEPGDFDLPGRQSQGPSGNPVYPAPREKSVPDPGFLPPPEKNFKARLAIPPQEEPLDDTWKGRHRSKRRRNRRVQRVENAAQSFLDSRGFQIARVLLILLSAAMLAWLFQYLRTHQWQLPGLSPSVADEPKPAATGGLMNAGATELWDDDTEIPPAASRTPSWQDAAGLHPPVAAPPVSP